MSKEEKKQLYKDYKESGMSITDYCKIKNVSVPVLRGLQTYYENKLSNDEFIMVKPSENPVDCDSNESEIEFYINDLKIRIQENKLSKIMKLRDYFYD